MILIPERPYDLEEVAALIRRRHRRGENYSVVVVAEGIEPPAAVELQKDAFGFDRLGGVAYQLAPMIEERLLERETVLPEQPVGHQEGWATVVFTFDQVENPGALFRIPFRE